MIAATMQQGLGSNLKEPASAFKPRAGTLTAVAFAASIYPILVDRDHPTATSSPTSMSFIHHTNWSLQIPHGNAARWVQVNGTLAICGWQLPADPHLRDIWQRPEVVGAVQELLVGAELHGHIHGTHGWQRWDNAVDAVLEDLGDFGLRVAKHDNWVTALGVKVVAADDEGGVAILRLRCAEGVDLVQQRRALLCVGVYGDKALNLRLLGDFGLLLSRDTAQHTTWQEGDIEHAHNISICLVIFLIQLHAVKLLSLGVELHLKHPGGVGLLVVCKE